MPTWVTVVLLLLLVGALGLPSVLEWVVDGRADLAIAGVGGLLGVGIALGARHRRERKRS